MKPRITKLLAEIEANHEISYGPEYCSGATGTQCSGKCPICGLEVTQYQGSLDDPDSTEFFRDGKPICMADAVECR